MLTSDALGAVHFISSLFYASIKDKIAAKHIEDMPHSKVNIFEKRYIIIPYNLSNTHWGLFVICNPKNVAKCMTYTQTQLKGMKQKELKEESASYILHFDSLNPAEKRLKRRFKKIRNTILTWLIEEARKMDIEDYKILAEAHCTKSIPSLVLPVFNADNGKSYFVLYIIQICQVFTSD